MLLDGVVLDWDIFRALVAAAENQPPADLDVTIMLLTAALELVSTSSAEEAQPKARSWGSFSGMGPFSGMGHGAKAWKWVDLDSVGEMEQIMDDAAHWLAELG